MDPVDREIEYLQARTAELRKQGDHLEARNAELRAQIREEEAEEARLEAKLYARPFVADHPFAYAFLMVTVPVWTGYFAFGGEVNRTGENLATGLALGIGLWLGLGLIMFFLARHRWGRKTDSA